MKNVGIFCGGYSSEFDISILSAKTILSHFPEGYRAFMVEVRPEGWTAVYEGKNYGFNPWDLSFNADSGTIKLDIALVYIHGNPGEDGKLQAFFDLKQIPYINSGPLASELSFDKWYCNQFLKGFGIACAKSVLLRKGQEVNEAEMIRELGLPCFVKPADSGSSYGISKVHKSTELGPAIEKAFKEGDSLVIEAFLDGTEVTCGVYRNKNGIHALPLTEISSDNDFFDYEAKYLGKSKEITPARISDKARDEIQEKSKKIYELMNLRSIARIDFMLVKDEVFLIEVNTTPGFSPASIVPQMIACDGKTIRQFWEEIIEVELGK